MLIQHTTRLNQSVTYFQFIYESISTYRVQYDDRYLDKRNRSTSKARLILNLLRDHPDKAFFSKEIAEELKPLGVKISDSMSNARRFERKGLIYI